MHPLKILVLHFIVFQTAAFASLRPNFLIIYADDLGYGDVSTYHASDVLTPNIDRLAGEGMLFTGMRANCTVCSPSRAALLTGRYADRVGVPGVIRAAPDDSWGCFKPDVPTLADELRKTGYQTAIIGKWHLGLEAPNTPNQRGFDHFHGFLGDMMDSYTTHLRDGINYMRLNSETIDPQGHATDIFTDWACSYLRERSAGAKPFFLHLAYNAPHFPIEPPADWLQKVKERLPGLEEKRAKNVALVEHLDHRIGMVLAALKDGGMEENTVVVFTSDNGGALPYAQSNAPWRGGKQDHYDGGLRVPFIVRWPGKVKAGTRSDYQGLCFDIFPTFLEIARVPPPSGLDAVSLLPVLEGMTPASPRELYFVRREGGHGYGGKSYEAIIRDGWKLMQNDPYSPLELYNLNIDPHEKQNLVKEAPAKVAELAPLLRKHIQSGGGTPWRKTLPDPDSTRSTSPEPSPVAETKSPGAAASERISARPGLVITTLGFGSCARQDRPQPIWDAIHAAGCDAFVLCGDNIYADTSDSAVFREKYAMLAAMPGFAALRRTTPLFATWDDHDYGLNDGGAGFPGAAVAQQEFCDFFQAPATSPLRASPGVYDCITFGPPGKRVQLILLDTRSFRSPLKKDPANPKINIPNIDPGATLLGDEQWSWLGRRLREPAEVRAVVSSISFISTEHGSEKWANFPQERARFLELLRSTGAEGAVLISGDRHLAELSLLKTADGAPYELHEMTTSGLNQPVAKESEYGSANPPKGPPNRYRIHERPYTGSNFGLMRIKWDGPHPSVRLEVCGLDGHVVFSRNIHWVPNAGDGP